MLSVDNKFRRHKVSPALYALAQGHWGLIAVVEVQRVGEVAGELPLRLPSIHFTRSTILSLSLGTVFPFLSWKLNV